MKLLTSLAQITGGMPCGDEDWGSVLKHVSRVRLDKEVSGLAV